MKRITASVVLNVTGQIFLYSSLGAGLNSWLIFFGIVFLLAALLLLVFFKSNFTEINGILVSSKGTIIQKYFITPFIFLMFAGFFFSLVFAVSRFDELGLEALLIIIPILITYFILRNLIRIKGIKFNESFLHITNYIETTQVDITSVKWVKSGFPSMIYKLCYEKDRIECKCFFMVGTGPIGHFLGFENGLKELEERIADRGFKK
jgi:hypothetical protein